MSRIAAAVTCTEVENIVYIGDFNIKIPKNTQFLILKGTYLYKIIKIGVFFGISILHLKPIYAKNRDEGFVESCGNEIMNIYGK